MAFVGLDLAKVRKLARDLDSAGSGAAALHREVSGILMEAQEALDPGQKATHSPDLAVVQQFGQGAFRGANSYGMFGPGVLLPGSLQSELPSIAKEMRHRCTMVDEAVEKHGFGQGITPMDAFNGITPQPPAKPEKKGWFQQYITDPIKNGIEDVGDFMSSVFNWRSILDAGSMALGTFLMAAGGGMEVGGFALDGTGAGAAVGIPVNVAGAAVFTSGATLAAGGFGDFMTQMSEGGVDNAWDRSGSRGSSGGGPEPRPVSSEEQEAFTKNQEELAKLSKNKQITEVKKGIERDGKKYKPEQDLLSGKKHGIDWTEGPARLEKEGKPQGQFGSPADVHFATEKGAELGPRNQGIFKLPEGNTCIQYELDDTGAVQIVKPDSIFVKVYPNGKIHAYPFKR